MLTPNDEAPSRIVGAARTWLTWPLLYGICAGSGAWALAHPHEAAGLRRHQLSAEQSAEALGWALGGLAVVVAFYLAAVLGHRVVARRWDLIGPAAWLNRVLVALLALPLVAALRTPSIESTDPIWSVCLAALIAGFLAASVYALSGSEPLLPGGRGAERLSRWVLPVGLLGLWAGYAVFFSDLAITNHHSLNTRTIDLGYYDNIFYQSIHGNPLGCSLINSGTHVSAHTDPILVLLSPLYLIYPRAELILVLQSVWLGSGVVPLALLARRKLRSAAAAWWLALAYALYPALHGANMYEFHSLTLMTPLALWLLYFYESRATKRYGLVLLLLLLCREDVPLVIALVGVYAVMQPRRGSSTLGWATIFVCAAYYIAIKRYVMPTGMLNDASREGYSYAYYFKSLIPHGDGIQGLMTSVLVNPTYALQSALTNPKKILYLLYIFAPLGLLPLVAPRGRIMLLFGLAFTMLADREAVYRIHFQYSSWLTPFAFVLTVFALEHVASGRSWLVRAGLDSRRLGRALIAFIVVASALVSWKHGALVSNASFRGGFERIARQLSPRDKERYAWLEATVAQIPPEASVLASNHLGPHISNRRQAYLMRQGKSADYVLVDEGELRSAHRSRIERQAKRGELVEMDRFDRIALYRRAGAEEQVPLEPPAAATASPSATTTRSAGQTTTTAAD